MAIDGDARDEDRVMLMRECVYCRAVLERGTVPFSIERDSYRISWKALPAWICSQCGEPCFEPAIVSAIEESLRGIDRAMSGLTATADAFAAR